MATINGSSILTSPNSCCLANDMWPMLRDVLHVILNSQPDQPKTYVIDKLYDVLDSYCMAEPNSDTPVGVSETPTSIGSTQSAAALLLVRQLLAQIGPCNVSNSEPLSGSKKRKAKKPIHHRVILQGSNGANMGGMNVSSTDHLQSSPMTIQPSTLLTTNQERPIDLSVRTTDSEAESNGASDSNVAPTPYTPLLFYERTSQPSVKAEEGARLVNEVAKITADFARLEKPKLIIAQMNAVKLLGQFLSPPGLLNVISHLRIMQQLRQQANISTVVPYSATRTTVVADEKLLSGEPAAKLSKSSKKTLTTATRKLSPSSNGKRQTMTSKKEENFNQKMDQSLINVVGVVDNEDKDAIDDGMLTHGFTVSDGNSTELCNQVLKSQSSPSLVASSPKLKEKAVARYSCPYCQRKVIVRGGKDAKNTHVCIYKDPQNNMCICSCCSQQFKHYSNARRHAKYVHLKDYRPYQCTNCLRRFLHPYELRNHTETCPSRLNGCAAANTLSAAAAAVAI